MEKQCSKCNVVKDVSEFNSEKRNRDGLSGVCKACRKPYYKKYQEANKEKAKRYREANKKRLADYNKKYQEVNKEKLKQYREVNKEKIKEVSRIYREKNREKLNEKARAKHKANKRKPTLQETNLEQEKKRLFEEGKKRCNKCNIVKNIAEFNKSKKNTDGLRGECKVCRKKYNEDNKEKLYNQRKRWREENIERIKVKRKKYYEDNKERLADSQKIYMKGYINK